MIMIHDLVICKLWYLFIVKPESKSKIKVWAKGDLYPKLKYDFKRFILEHDEIKTS